MKLFLLYKEWNTRPPPLSGEQVASRLSAMFSPLYEGLSEPVVRHTAAGTLVHLGLPVRGFKPPFVEEDHQTWVLSPDYPVDARRCLGGINRDPGRDPVLPALCRELEMDAARLLPDLAPPFSAIWHAKTPDEWWIQNDGLGRSQLYEYSSDRMWALTNRPFALQALGVALRPDPLEWAVRWSIRHFLGDHSGFRDVRFLAPGTQLRLARDRIVRAHHDVAPQWIVDVPQRLEDACELAHASLASQLQAGTALFEEPSMGLSGGWDSRMVASAMHHLGIPFKARVRGEEWRSDVVLATRLAELASVPLKVQHKHVKLPPDSTDACRKSILMALLFQAGGRSAHGFKCSCEPAGGCGRAMPRSRGTAGRWRAVTTGAGSSLPSAATGRTDR